MARTDPFLPTDREQASLARMSAWRGRMLLLPVLPLLVFVLSRILSEEHVMWMMALAGVAGATLLAVMLYVSFGLRCPRCNGWIGLGSSRCLSCGLKTAPRPRPAWMPGK